MWVLAPMSSKSMGAEEPTAPILTWALVGQKNLEKIGRHMWTAPYRPAPSGHGHSSLVLFLAYFKKAIPSPK